jgi:hypothetical protein
MPSGGDDQSESNAPGNSGGRGSSSSSSGGGYASGGNSNSPNAGGGYSGGSPSGDSQSAPSYSGNSYSGQGNSNSPNAGGGYSGGNPSGNSQSAPSSGGRGGLGTAAGAVAASSPGFMGFVGADQIGSIGTRSQTAAGNVATAPSFESLTRSMNAPALGMMTSPAPSYAKGTMAYDMSRPTDMRSSVAANSVPSYAVSGRGVAPMGSTLTSLDDAKQSFFSMVAGVEGGRHGANAVSFSSSLGVSKMDVVGTTVADMISTMEKADNSANKSYKADRTYVGSYQLGRSALKSALAAGVVSPTQNLDEKAQKAVADMLTDRRAKQATVNGVVDETRLAKALAQEFAALPTVNEKSYYAGRAGNKSAKSLSYADVKSMAATLAAAYNGEKSAKAGTPAKASFAQSYLGATPTISAFANTPAVGPSVAENRNMAAVGNRMDAEKADKVAAAEFASAQARSFANRYLSAEYEDGPKSVTAAPPTAVAQATTQAEKVAAVEAATGVTFTGKKSHLSSLNADLAYAVAQSAKEVGWKGTGTSVGVNSAARSVAHNEKVGGVPGSYHTQKADDGTAKAIDINTRGTNKSQRSDMVAAINSKPGVHAIDEDDHIHAQMSRPGITPAPTTYSKSITPTAPTPTATEYAYASQPSLTGPGSAATASSGMTAADIAAYNDSVTTKSSTEGLAPGTSVSTQTASASTQTETPTTAKGLGIAGKTVAAAIDILTGMVPGVGMVNGALTLTGNKSIGTMVAENFANGTSGKAPGEDQYRGGPDNDLPPEEKTDEAPIATAASLAFSQKYIFPEKKYPTPQEKWGGANSG